MNNNAILEILPLEFVWQTLDPFLFCVHHEDFYPAGNGKYGPAQSLAGRNIGQDFTVKDGWRMYHGEKIPGFPGHPHRGFETVTFVKKGLIDHSDSHGASGRYGDGDVQWMTAGSGLQHSEMFPLFDTEKENTLELFQIWLNLPRKNKMVKPTFKMLWSDSIPKFALSDKAGKKLSFEVAAGTLEGHAAPDPTPDSWAANKENQVGIWHIDFEAEAEYTLAPGAAALNRMLYFYRGESMTMNEKSVKPGYGVRVKSDESITLKNGNKAGKLLILQGKPIQEPVVQYGPFVMNTRQEIEQAFSDYQRTQFGGWPWDSHEPVHGPYQGRFAKHADGRVETRV